MSSLIRVRRPELAVRRGAALLAVALLVSCGDSGTDPVPLVAPTGVTATGTSATTMRVSFTAASGATGYVIERAPASGGSFAVAGDVTTPPFDDDGLSPTTAYRYQVASIRGADTSDFSPIAVGTTLAPGSAGLDTLSGNITTNTTLDRDVVWVLHGFVKVQSGATLTIESGTKIVGDSMVPGSALFILRGAQINAVGTAANPIVFTSQRAPGFRKPGDWGGLIIVGNGQINRTNNPTLEGSDASGVPNGGPPGIQYGGGTVAGDAESSGILQYVRVEFAGYAVLPNVELNTFTFAAVGSGTTMDHLQSVAGLDDSFEWFGGAVNAKYLVSYESGDDHFDAAEGYRGKNQFLIAMQSTQIPIPASSGGLAADPQGFEIDGCDTGSTGCGVSTGASGQSATPYTMPVFANFTVIGTGTTTTSGSSGGVGMVVRRGAGGTYINGVVARYPRRGISVRDTTTFNRVAVDSVTMRAIFLADNAAGNFDSTGTKTRLGATNFEESAATAASLFVSLPSAGSTFLVGAIDLTPAAASPIATGGLSTFTGPVAARAGTFITPTAYRGAADPSGPKWWDGWTAYFQN